MSFSVLTYEVRMIKRGVTTMKNVNMGPDVSFGPLHTTTTDNAGLEPIGVIGYK